MKTSRVIAPTKILFVAALVLCGSSAPQDPYSRCNLGVAREIRIWAFRPEGSELNQLDVLLHRLELDYSSDHPGTTFVHQLNGDDSALGGVYMGAADMALMSRDPSYIELDGYQQVIAGQKPFVETVMRGRSRAGPSLSPLVVIVNRRNPLRRISQRELKCLFSGQCDRSGCNTPRWTQLGLSGPWASHPVRIYGFGIRTVEAEVFREVALGGNRRWSCAYREIRNTRTSTAAEQIQRAVEDDPNAIGLTTLAALSGGTKVVATERAQGAGSLPTNQSLASGEYLLGRSIIAVARADESGLPNQSVRAFLEYLVSARAAKLIETGSRFVPASRTPEAKVAQ